MNTLKTYGLGNYVVDSFPVGPGMYQYEYASRFVEIDQDSGYVTEYSLLPNLTAVPIGGSTFDANNGRYIVNGIDSNMMERIFVIDASDGSIISDLPTTTAPFGSVIELEYNNVDDKLYGFYRDFDQETFAIVSVDLSDNSVDTVVMIPDLQFITQGASVFHQLTQTYIMYYIDTANVNRLLLVDVVNGVIAANPQISTTFTEIETDNNQFAMLNYHNLTSVEEVEPKDNELNIYPNPASSIMNYDFSSELTNGDDLQLEIRDLSGKLANRIPIVNSNGSFDIGHLPSGIYIVSLVGPTDVISQKKLIVF
jgi:hypothetical protein